MNKETKEKVGLSVDRQAALAYLLLIVIVLLSLLFTVFIISEIYAADPSEFVKYWAWQQYAHGKDGNESATVGLLNVMPDHNFRIWWAEKDNSNNCYNIGETGGTWKKIAPRIYRAYYGAYFYEVFITGDVASFILMSIQDNNDRGHFEVGTMHANINMSTIMSYYTKKACK